MSRTRILGLLCFATSVALLTFTADVRGGGASETKVKAKATASKTDAKGTQTVSITLAIDKDWHLYANPVNHNKDFLNPNKTVVTFAVNGKAVRGVVSYPVGKTKTDGENQYNIYVDAVKLDATVQRAPGDTNPLEITIAVNACDPKVCLNRGTIKLTVP